MCVIMHHAHTHTHIDGPGLLVIVMYGCYSHTRRHPSSFVYQQCAYETFFSFISLVFDTATKDKDTTSRNQDCQAVRSLLRPSHPQKPSHRPIASAHHHTITPSHAVYIMSRIANLSNETCMSPICSVCMLCPVYRLDPS